MTARRRSPTVREHLAFLGRFLKDPRQVGAVAPSSRTLARAMVRHLPMTPSSHIVELGPGTGVFTGEVLEHLPRGAKFLAVEIDPTFCRSLSQEWPDLDCACASAADLPALIADRGWRQADHVISGLPFASLPAEVSRAILDAVHATLKPGGTFTTFQYIHAYQLPPARAFRHEMTRRIGPMAHRWQVFRNVPPAFVLSWRQRD